MTDFRILTAKTLMPLVNLDVADNQQDFVAPNAITMAQSLFEAGTEIYGMWVHETPVGMMAIVDMAHPDQELEPDDNPDGVYVWRLMVAKEHQGKGHGREAMRFAEKRCKEIGRSYVLLSAVDSENGAIPFYEKQGYTKTGKIVDGETEMAKVLKPILK